MSKRTSLTSQAFTCQVIFSVNKNVGISQHNILWDLLMYSEFENGRLRWNGWYDTCFKHNYYSCFLVIPWCNQSLFKGAAKCYLNKLTGFPLFWTGFSSKFAIFFFFFKCSLGGCYIVPEPRQEADSLGPTLFPSFIPFFQDFLLKSQKKQDFSRCTVILKVFQGVWEPWTKAYSLTHLFSALG